MTLDKNCKKGGVHRAPGSRDASGFGLGFRVLGFRAYGSGFRVLGV